MVSPQVPRAEGDYHTNYNAEVEARAKEATESVEGINCDTIGPW